MKSTAKAQAQARELKEKLALRLKGSASIDQVRQANDANGWPILFCSNGGAEAAGDEVIALRIKAQDAVSKDIFGNSLTAFSPHAIELAYEAGEPSLLNLALVMVEVAKIGMKLEIKVIPALTAVSEASMNAAAPAASHEYEVQWPSKGM